ncbi:MAG: DUF2752 domain-containing protein [Actinomycetia bacterium]|nr:DUF2752 domain-containing protein [Actinomycetes bacterium]
MQSTLTSRHRWLRRGLPIACACATAGLAAVVATNDPAATNSRFPPCIFHASTGLWCPGCGLTRGLHQLLNGHVGAALGYNVFIPLAVVAALLGWWSWLRTSWDKPPLAIPAWLLRPLVWGLPIAIVTYGVLRNIPAAPFSALAP